MSFQRDKRLTSKTAALTAFLLALSPASSNIAYAQSPAQPMAAASGLAAQIGVAAAVQGKVEVASPGAVGRETSSGRPIYLGDTVTTDAEGRLQILLLDETVFTIGPNSSIVIDEFVYDPATHDGKIAAQVIKGAFRFVTGKIAHKKPENMKVDLPSGTIGVRGTMVAGRVEGNRSMVALMGPGPDNQVGARIGRIEVGNEVNHVMQNVQVMRPGFGTVIKGANIPPTPPAAIPMVEMEALKADLAVPARGPHQKDDGEDRGPRARRMQGREPGQDEDSRESGLRDRRGPRPMRGPHEGPDDRSMDPPSAEELQKMHATGMIDDGQLNEMMTDMEAWQSGDSETRAALMEKYEGQDPYMDPNHDPVMDPYHVDPYTDPNYADYNDPYYNDLYDTTTESTQASADNTAAILAGTTTKAELAKVETGQFHYTASGAFIQNRMNGTTANINGTMNVVLNIDFGSRTIGGGGSLVSVDSHSAGGNILHTMNINSIGFNSSPGDLATYNQNNGLLDATLKIKNAGGVIGGAATIGAVYNDSTKADSGSGLIQDIPRASGLQ